jgi:hypothetical protein
VKTIWINVEIDEILLLDQGVRNILDRVSLIESVGKRQVKSEHGLIGTWGYKEDGE